MNKQELKHLLEYTCEHNLSHIPSALSWYDFMKAYIGKNWYYTNILGKFWGTQSLDLIFGEDYKSTGFFSNTNYETIGDTLGYAAGIALASVKPVVVTLSDSVFQSGYVYEALNFIMQHQLNILIMVDWNNEQATGRINSICSIEPIRSLTEDFMEYVECDGHSNNDINYALDYMHKLSVPRIIWFRTVKGHGIEHLGIGHYSKVSEDQIDEIVSKSYLPEPGKEVDSKFIDPSIVHNWCWSD